MVLVALGDGAAVKSMHSPKHTVGLRYESFTAQDEPGQQRDQLGALPLNSAEMPLDGINRSVEANKKLHATCT